MRRFAIVTTAVIGMAAVTTACSKQEVAPAVSAPVSTQAATTSATVPNGETTSPPGPADSVSPQVAVDMSLARAAGSTSAMGLVCEIVGAQATLDKARDDGAAQIAKEGGSPDEYKRQFDAGAEETKSKFAMASAADRQKGCSQLQALKTMADSGAAHGALQDVMKQNAEAAKRLREKLNGGQSGQ